MIGRDNEGRFISGHQESIDTKQKRSLSLIDSWKGRDDYHGMYGTKFYNTWRSMKNRCDGTSSAECNAKYHDKGIRYCERWRSFANFYEDMYPIYIEGYQLDRKENSLGYFKDNCRWVTPKQNSNNRTNNIKIEYLGQTKTLSEWSDYFGINFTTIRNRYYKFYLKGVYGIDNLFRN